MLHWIRVLVYPLLFVFVFTLSIILYNTQKKFLKKFERWSSFFLFYLVFLILNMALIVSSTELILYLQKKDTNTKEKDLESNEQAAIFFIVVFICSAFILNAIIISRITFLVHHFHLLKHVHFKKKSSQDHHLYYDI